MKARTYIAGAAAAGLLSASAFLVPAMASTQAGCACGFHTARFISITKSTLVLSKTSVAQQDTDVNWRGRVIGFDQLNLTFNPKTGKGHGNFTFDTKGGFIYGTLKLNASARVTGRLTGGTGKFRGVTGTISARNLNRSGTKTAVTLRYRLR
jgi:hypothetical protein